MRTNRDLKIMKNIKVGDIYWMPRLGYIDKKSQDTKLIISRIGRKFIYAVREEGSKTEYTFTFESEGVLDLVNDMIQNKAYSEKQWEKQKLIRELNNLSQRFRMEFSHIQNSTDFNKCQEYLSEMHKLAQEILKRK